MFELLAYNGVFGIPYKIEPIIGFQQSEPKYMQLENVDPEQRNNDQLSLTHDNK
jgi:hypothetical protein